MITRPINSQADQANFPKTSILGIIFFLMGAPNLYSLLNSRPAEKAPAMFPRFLLLAVFAGAIASAIELSMF